MWEETIIYCPKNIQLLALSATVGNPADLKGWISRVHGPTEVVTSSWRPVPLTFYYARRPAPREGELPEWCAAGCFRGINGSAAAQRSCAGGAARDDTDKRALRPPTAR